MTDFAKKELGGVARVGLVMDPEFTFSDDRLGKVPPARLREETFVDGHASSMIV
ncbi:hypothetical protein KIN20_036894, partial [Parelaphostrongylus tenuis]